MGSQSTRDFTKVVIRQLPPTLQEADCKAAVDKEFADRYNWFSFARGKTGQKTTQQSTAYLNFRAAADVLDFKVAFEGATFPDARGKQQPCSVEYAPFQRVPRGRVKRDPREGTIEKDAAYTAFLKGLEKQPEALPTAEQQLDQRLEAGASEGAGVRIVTPLMAYLQEKSTPKERERRKAQPRKGAAGGRSLVGSALASISEAAEGDNSSRKQSKASSRAAAGSGAAQQRTTSRSGAAEAAPDSAQAARQAALRALGSLRLSSEPQPGQVDSTAAADGTTMPPVKLKKRDAPTKEPKVRPGFGAFVPRAARQQDGGNSSGSVASDAAAASGTPPASASAARAKAAAAAAQAPAKVSAADRGKRPQQQQSTSPRQRDKQQGRSSQKQQQLGPHQEEQHQQLQQEEPVSPQQPKQHRSRGNRQGGKHATAAQDSRRDSAAAATANMSVQTTDAAGSLAAETPASAPAGGSSRRHRGHATVPGREATPAPGVQGAPAAADPAAPQAGTRKGGRQRSRPKSSGDAQSHS